MWLSVFRGKNVFRGNSGAAGNQVQVLVRDIQIAKNNVHGSFPQYLDVILFDDRGSPRRQYAVSRTTTAIVRGEGCSLSTLRNTRHGCRPSFPAKLKARAGEIVEISY